MPLIRKFFGYLNQGIFNDMLSRHFLTACNETTLLSAIARGDEKAFAELFSRHKDRVYTIAFTYTENRNIAEEIVQDVFVRLWRNRHKLEELENFSSWIYVIARNRSLTALRKMAMDGKRKEDLISYLLIEA